MKKNVVYAVFIAMGIIGGAVLGKLAALALAKLFKNPPPDQTEIIISMAAGALLGFIKAFPAARKFMKNQSRN